MTLLERLGKSLGIDFGAVDVQIIRADSLARFSERTPFSSGELGIPGVRPTLITGISSPALFAATKTALERVFESGQPVKMVSGSARSIDDVLETTVSTLDSDLVGDEACIWIDSIGATAPGKSFDGLARIVARLRAPGGCPWDQKQTAQSLVDSLLEEAYEAAEAIQSGDAAHSAEELGDLQLLIVMEAQIAEETGNFTIEDVLQSISSKLIRRHPHVFGDDEARSAEDVVGIWQQVKATEGKAPKPAHPLDRYPAPMPIARRLADYISVSPDADDIDSSVLGQELYRLTRAALESGHDPEKLLLAAARAAIPEDQAH